MLTWFNMFGLEGKLEPGVRVLVTGKAGEYGGRKQMMQPAFTVLDGAEEVAARGARLEPVYPASAELSSAVIGRIAKGVVEARRCRR